MAEKSKNKRSIVLSDNGYLSYLDFSKLSLSDKLRRRLNIAKAQFDNGSLAKAGYALVGGYDPENPRLSTGDVPNPGMRNPKLITQTVQKAKSIAERAAKISDKIFDRQYLKAIKSKDSKRILTVRDLHFKAKTGINNPYIFLHATDNKFNSFDVNRTGQNFAEELSNRNGKGVYFTLHMSLFTPEEISKFPDIYGDIVMPLKVWFRNPEKTRRSYHILSSPNYDGYIYLGGDLVGEAFIKNPKLIKSAYAITYDNKGDIIPISQRDNFLINDIRYKQGGKMNILEFLKNGSGIHIKKKNRGKFTSYCGGKVTDECILKGKNSSNPAIRKRATFAANARKWKHKEGGIIKASCGTKTSWISNSLGKVGNILNSDWGKLAASGISSMFGGGSSEPSYNNNYSDIMANTALLYMLNQQLENEVLNNYDKIMSKLHFDPSNPNANGGSIVKNHVNYLAQTPIIAELKEFNNNYKKFLDEQVKLQKNNYITNALTNTLLTGFDIALNYKPTIKKGSSVS